MPIRYKTEEEIAILREGGKIHARILKEIAKKVKPGVKSADLNTYAEKLLDEAGATAAFLGYMPKGARRPYPASLCVSVNDEVVHGIPNEDYSTSQKLRGTGPKVLKEGDIVTLDLGVKFKGMITDAAITVPVGKVEADAMKLIRATEEALSAGIKAIKLGGHVGDIGAAVLEVAERNNLRLAEDLSGHGVGYSVHEEPFVPNDAEEGDGPELKLGLVIAIEPMLCEGSGEVKLLKDGYTYSTRDGKRAAHFEHTVALTKKGVEVLTKF
jgi:methionyl aminopeptidase